MLDLILAEKAPEPEPVAEQSIKEVLWVTGAGVGAVSILPLCIGRA